MTLIFDNTPRWPTPKYLKVVKLNYSWSVIRPVIYDQGQTHFFTATQNTTERMEEKNKRTNIGLCQLQAQEGGSPCDNFVQLSVHLQAIAGVYFARNFYKASNNADIFLRWLTRPL